MTRRPHVVLAGAILVTAAGCTEATGSRFGITPSSLAAAFTQAPAAAGDLSTSYVGRGAAEEGDSTGFMGRGPRGHGPGRGEMMGGGMGAEFLGLVGFDGRGGHHGPFRSPTCDGNFDAASGRLVCTPATLRNGLAVTRSIAYASASGAVQQAFDSLATDRVNVQSSVTGTFTFTPDDDHHDGPRGDMGPGGPGGPGGPDGHRGPGGPGGPLGRLFGDTARIITVSTTVSSASDRTVTGLSSGSTQRTVEGSSRGTESTAGTSSRGAFTVTRVAGDTTMGLVIPVSTTGPTYPTAGTVIREMKATLTYEGADPVTAARREVVTYDGSATAKIVITENGVTKHCTRALPRGELSCQ